KKLLYGMVLPLVAITLVMAGLIAYYGLIQTEVTIERAV
ncbi:unnamed protein product, partial [marine sediment metagenome]